MPSHQATDLQTLCFPDKLHPGLRRCPFAAEGTSALDPAVSKVQLLEPGLFSWNMAVEVNHLPFP